MDRLTKRGFDPELEFCAECDYHGEPNGCNRARGDCSAYTVFTEAYTRLAAYEDTGLTPEEIVALKADRDQWQDGTIIVKLADTEADRDAWRRRAEAAERDMAFACGSQPSASSDCSICDICAHKRDDGSCAKQCFMNAMAAMNRWEWRGL